MEMDFNALLERITDFLQKQGKSETIIGAPFTLGEYSCVPVVRVGMGFGSGGGGGDSPKNGKGQGAGAGVGMGVEPIGFLVSKGSEISFISTNQNRGLSNAFEKIPDLIKVYMENKKEKE
jgi:uncharacterized spore protein YtfJ